MFRRSLFSFLPFYFLFIFFVKSTKVSQRFEHLYSPNSRCVVQSLSFYSKLGTGSIPPFWKGLLEKVYHFHRLNCTQKVIEYEATGLPDENGTYNGLIGQIQRNLQDIAFVLVRPDSLPFEPGKIGAVVGPADVTVVSHRNESKRTVYELTHFLDLDRTVYFYSIFCLFFLFACLYSFCEVYLRNQRSSLKRFMKKYRETVHKIIDLLFDQEGFESRTRTGMILAFFASLFIFFSIHGILLNNISADLVVNVKPPTIDSLDDLLEHPIQPLVAKKLFIHELLKASPKGSRLHRLWLRTGANGSNGILDFDISNGASAFPKAYNLLEDLAKSEKALILPNIFIEVTFKPSMCLYMPKETSKFNVAENLFAPGLFTGLMSNKIHPYTEKAVNYIFSTIFESHFLMAAARFSTYDMPSMFECLGKSGIQYNGKVIQCIGKKNENQQNALKFNALKLINIASLFRVYLYLSLFAFIPHFVTLWISKEKKNQRITKTVTVFRARNSAYIQRRLSILQKNRISRSKSF